MIIDSKEFYLLCAQAVMGHNAVVLVGRAEFDKWMKEEDEYLKQKGLIPTIYGPFAQAGYDNFVTDDPADPAIVTLFEVVG